MIPLYYILAHFWALTPVDVPKEVKQVTAITKVDVAKKHFTDVELCKTVGTALKEEDDQTDRLALALEGTKVLFNFYYCLPVFIDKENQL
jgi:hypothetical protein